MFYGKGGPNKFRRKQQKKKRKKRERKGLDQDAVMPDELAPGPSASISYVLIGHNNK